MNNTYARTDEILRCIEVSSAEGNALPWGDAAARTGLDEKTCVELVNACNANGYLRDYVDFGSCFFTSGLTEKGRRRLHPHRWTRIEKTMAVIELLIDLVCTLFD